MSSSDRDDQTLARRDFVKAAAYTAPAILTLKALPAFASQGSGSLGIDRGGQGDVPVTGGGGIPPTNPGSQGNGGTGGSQGGTGTGGNQSGGRSGGTGGNGGNGGTGRGRGN